MFAPVLSLSLALSVALMLGLAALTRGEEEAGSHETRGLV
jgi:hypothetical protein